MKDREIRPALDLLRSELDVIRFEHGFGSEPETQVESLIAGLEWVLRMDTAGARMVGHVLAVARRRQMDRTLPGPGVDHG